jgi:hypothetical protein
MAGIGKVGSANVQAYQTQVAKRPVDEGKAKGEPVTPPVEKPAAKPAGKSPAKSPPLDKPQPGPGAEGSTISIYA